MYSRRDFGKIAVTGLSMATAWGAKINSTVSGVRLGCSTYSFRDFPRTPGTDNIDAIIEAFKTCEVGVVELYAPNAEPARAKGMDNNAAREALRAWRLATPMDYFKKIRKKFDDNGMSLVAYTLNYGANFTDAEIEKTFEQVHALGLDTVCTSTRVDMIPRLMPLAAKHKVYVAFHGHSQITDPNEFSTPATFKKAMDVSKWAKVNLDIGHFTGANEDPVAYIKEHHDRISLLHMKDKKKNDGPNQPFGQGDTPIKEVLLLLKEKKYPIPASIEYEYKGPGTSVEEVKKCMAYERQILA